MLILPPVQRDAFTPLTDTHVARVRALRSTLEAAGTRYRWERLWK